MAEALSRSKRPLALVLTLLMIVTGISALSLALAPAAHADGPGISFTCSDTFDACSSTIKVVGSNPPDDDGNSTGGQIKTHVPGPFGFLGRCQYNVVDSTGTGHGDGNYPLQIEHQSDGYAQCQAEGDLSGNRSVTQKKEPSPYYTTIYATPKGCVAKKIDGKWTAATGIFNYTTGWKKVAGSNPVRWTIHFTTTCVYPTHNSYYYANPWTRTCIVSGVYRLYYSTSAATISNAGSGGWGAGTQEGPQSGTKYPDPHLNKKNAENCKQTIESTWDDYQLTQSTTYGGPLYGFYRFSVKGVQITCSGTDPAAWTGNTKTSSCDESTERTTYQHIKYTYTCQSSGFEKTPDPQQSDDQYFDPAGCIDYTCTVNPTKIANQSPATDVAVLRNGKQTNDNIGNFSVTGRGLSRVSDKQVKVNVVDGSSPYNTESGVTVNTAPNGGSDKFQYFQLWNKGTNTQLKFNQWWDLPSAAATPLKAGLMFYWASDPGKDWQQRQAYRFSGYFNVYRQDTVTSAPYKTPIYEPNAVCSERTYSSHVTALRSINQVDN